MRRRAAIEPNVILARWREGMRKVSVTRLLRAECGLSLGDAHRLVDRLLEGEAIEVAALLAGKLVELGVEATDGTAECHYGRTYCRGCP